MSVWKKLAWLTAAVALSLSTGAQAQQELSKDTQNCVNEINKRFSLVAKIQHKEVEKCIKDIAKGKSQQSAEECRGTDPKMKVKKQTDNVDKLYGKKCVEKEVDTEVASIFDTDMDGRAKAEGVDTQNRLLNAILGLDVGASVLLAPPGSSKEEKAASACQLGVVKELYKCQDTKLKEFLKCKKDGLKDGFIFDAASLQAVCLDNGIPDDKGKIAKACNDDGVQSGKVDKIRNATDKKCTSKGVPLADAFGGGECTGTDDEIRACLEAAVECDVCNAINSVDGTDIDCDLFDNGVADLSCGACRNASDQETLGMLTLPVAICVLGCGPGDLPCIEGCFGASFEDPTCGTCVAETVVCTGQFCINECGDPTSVECVNCISANGCFECL